MPKYLVEVEVTRTQKAVVVVNDDITTDMVGEVNADLVESFVRRQAIEQSLHLDAGSFVDVEKSTTVESVKKLPDNLSSDQLHLISSGYPIDKVVALTADDAESEVDAITYGPK